MIQYSIRKEQPSHCSDNGMTVSLTSISERNITVTNMYKAISDLVNKCIGNRTLDQASLDTGLSRNMLFRLKNGDFIRYPSEDTIKRLTSESSNPQNGVTFESFDFLFKERIEYDKMQAKNKSYCDTVFDSIVLRWLISIGDATVNASKPDSAGNSLTTLSPDLTASVNGCRYFFQYVSSVVMMDEGPLTAVKSNIVFMLSTCSVGKNDRIVIVTDYTALHSALTSLKLQNLNVNSSVMLVDTQTYSIISTDEISSCSDAQQ